MNRKLFQFTKTGLKDAYIVDINFFEDIRGRFFRVFCKDDFQEIGLHKEFVQINQSVNYSKGTFRGIHYQVPPPGDCKLIRCVTGRVLDIIVDIRRDSDTFLQSFTVELSPVNMRMVYISEGFAHGFLTLEDYTQLIYHHTSFYLPNQEEGIRYTDPLINLQLPYEPFVISERDKILPYLDDNFKGIVI
jgi:dTDP-4-dehydrorhamnose 3,5-epimerase